MKRSSLALFNGSYLGTKLTGIGVVARELINNLSEENIRLLDPFGSSRKGSIPIPNNLHPQFGAKGHFRRLIWTQKNLPELLKKYDAKFLLSPLPEAPIFRGIRSIVLAHDLLPLRYPKLSPLLAYHLAYVPLVLHNSERVLCNSEATAREIHEILHVPLKKIVTIPLGFNKSSIYPMKLKRKSFFLVLGRHDPHKNIARTLKAFAMIPNKEFHLFIVGPQDRRYTPRLKIIAEELGIESRCRWMAWVTDEKKLELLNTCFALVIPSLWEGFGLPALEAMACDTPVIASNAGALPEVVGDSGFLVDPKDSNSIAEAMNLLISDNQLKNNLIEEGRKRLKFYDWKCAAEKIENLLLSL
tara:strand:- start:632 stop:1702 length:1071 start_codon:yes stop_codon:yes gene_type:complete